MSAAGPRRMLPTLPRMDSVTFELAPAGGNYGEGLSQIKIQGKGVDPPEVVRAGELAWAGAAEGGGLAASYVGLVPGSVRIALASQFLGGSDTPLSPGPAGKTALLSCPCGEVGCSPLLARVTVDEDTVTWDEFEQPTRPDWSFEEFGPFTFSRPEYEQALLAVLDG